MRDFSKNLMIKNGILYDYPFQDLLTCEKKYGLKGLFEKYVLKNILTVFFKNIFQGPPCENREFLRKYSQKYPFQKLESFMNRFEGARDPIF